MLEVNQCIEVSYPGLPLWMGIMDEEQDLIINMKFCTDYHDRKPSMLC